VSYCPLLNPFHAANGIVLGTIGLYKAPGTSTLMRIRLVFSTRQPLSLAQTMSWILKIQYSAVVAIWQKCMLHFGRKVTTGLEKVLFLDFFGICTERYCYSKSSVRPSVCLSVCPSVPLMYRGQISWVSFKVITRIISLGSSLLGNPRCELPAI